jgi:hypothetical protein
VITVVQKLSADGGKRNAEMRILYETGQWDYTYTRSQAGNLQPLFYLSWLQTITTTFS